MPYLGILILAAMVTSVLGALAWGRVGAIAGLGIGPVLGVLFLLGTYTLAFAHGGSPPPNGPVLFGVSMAVVWWIAALPGSAIGLAIRSIKNSSPKPMLNDAGQYRHESVWMERLESAKFDLQLWAPRVLSVLRIVTALLFLEHGTNKLFGFPALISFPHFPFSSPIGFVIDLQAMIEIVGGFALLIGAFTRPLACILCGDMAVAYFAGPFRFSWFPLLNNGSETVLYCFNFLTLAVTGGGPWSVDALLRRRRR